MVRIVLVKREVGKPIDPILYYLLYSLALAGASDAIPGAYGVIKGEPSGWVLLAYGLALIGVAYVAKQLLRPSRPLTVPDAIMLAVATWIVVPIASAVPVTLALNVPLIDTWFEAVSGFTTTGLSMFNGAVDPDFHVYVPSVDQLPRCILLWRSFTQWLGGLGILVYFVALAMTAGLPPHLVGLAEGRYERLEPSIQRSIRRLFEIYVILTAAAILLLRWAGMSWFDAVNYAFAALSTGGFATHSSSVAYFHSVVIEVALDIAMLWGTINFATHYKVLMRGDLSAIKRDPELKALAVLIGAGTLVGTYLLVVRGMPFWEALRVASFQYISSQTTTGFQTVDIAKLPSDFKIMLVVACLTGGAILSTTGGIKLYRLVVLGKAIPWSARSETSARGSIVTFKVGDDVIDFNTFVQVAAVAAAYMIIFLVGFILTSLMLPKAPADNVAIEVASALGNVGISADITGAQQSFAYKLLFIVLMLLGRLEILPYFAALRAAWNRLTGRKRGRRRRLPRHLLEPTYVVAEELAEAARAGRIELTYAKVKRKRR